LRNRLQILSKRVHFHEKLIFDASIYIYAVFQFVHSTVY